MYNNKIFFGDIYSVRNDLTPFANTVKDKLSTHPSITVSTINYNGISVLCPGTKVRQNNNNKVFNVKPAQGTGLLYDTNFLLDKHFPIATTSMLDKSLVNKMGRPSFRQVGELQKKWEQY